MCAIVSSLHSWLINGLGREKGRRQAWCLAIVTVLRFILCDNEDVRYMGFGISDVGGRLGKGCDELSVALPSGTPWLMRVQANWIGKSYCRIL
jgi:hypothetical protein